jgi:hypothetical protein
MDTQSESPSLAELADAAGGLVAGLGILTIQIFPLALPLLVLVIGPLAVLGLAVAVLAIPLALPFWLGRIALRALRRTRPVGAADTEEPGPGLRDPSGTVQAGR